MPPSPTLQAWLQWSHVFSDMVSQTCQSDDKCGTGASMEPCLFRHGKSMREFQIPNTVHLLQWSHVFSDMVSASAPCAGSSSLPASMEPCLFRHGKRGRARRPRPSPSASMEPCLFRHGKNLGAPVNANDAARLQWSHVFSDMVRPRPGHRAAARSVASMEPCLFRHGKGR
mgnify:CR=1 FL=1